MRKPDNTDRSAGPKVDDIRLFSGPSQRVFCRMGNDLTRLIVVVSGVYRATVDTARGRQYIRAEPGHVVLWPRGTEDTDESEPGKPLRCLCMELHWPNMPPDLPFMVRDSEHMIDLLANRLLARAHDPVRKGVLDWVAHAYLAALLAEFVVLTEAAADNLLARVAQYTEEHMQERIRRAELARHVGMDPDHFGRKYRQLTGRTPLEDVRRRKAAYAKHVLHLSPAWPLERVAKLAGIRDASALSRLLKQYAGTSARDIKRAAKSNRR